MGARDFWWDGWVFPITRLTGPGHCERELFHPEFDHRISEEKCPLCVCHGTILRWRGDGEVECQGYSPDDTRWSFMEMTQHAWVATAPASVSTTGSQCILRAVKRSGKFCTVRRQMFKGFLSVCRLFSLASFSPDQRKDEHTQYRRRLCGFHGPADSSHPPLVFAPSSSSGSQAARHGRIPKPVPRLVCSSPIPAWIRHCVPDVLGSRSPLYSDIGFDHFENISRSSCASVWQTLRSKVRSTAVQ